MKVYKHPFEPDREVLAKKYVDEIIRQGLSDRPKGYYNPFIHVLTMKNNKVYTNTWTFKYDTKLGGYKTYELKNIDNKTQDKEGNYWFHSIDDRMIGYNSKEKKIVRIANSKIGTFDQKVEEFDNKHILIIIENSLTMPPFIYTLTPNRTFQKLKHFDYLLTDGIVEELYDILDTAKDDIIHNFYGELKRNYNHFRDYKEREITPFDIYDAISKYEETLTSEFIEFYKDGEVKHYCNKENHISMRSTRSELQGCVTITRTITAGDVKSDDHIIDKIIETWDKNTNTYRYKSELFYREILVTFTDDTWNEIKEVKVFNSFVPSYDKYDKFGKCIEIGEPLKIHKPDIKVHTQPINLNAKEEEKRFETTFEYPDILTRVWTDQARNNHWENLYDKKKFVNCITTFDQYTGEIKNYDIGFEGTEPHIIIKSYDNQKMSMRVNTKSRVTYENSIVGMNVVKEVCDSLLGTYDNLYDKGVKYYFSPVLSTKKYVYERDIYGIPYLYHNNYTFILKNFNPAINLY